MAATRTIGNRLAPPRFLMFIGLLIFGWAIEINWFGFGRGLLGGFDLAALAFLISCVPLFRLGTEDLRRAAAENDTNREVLLVISSLLAIIIFAAIAAQLDHSGGLTAADKLLIAATLVLVWTFGNAIYMLHYAHLYYLSGDDGTDRAGLKFPGTDEPNLADFAYFTFTLGVAAQTSDVAITLPHIRKVVTIHSIIAFFFNLGVLALTINVLGSA